MEWTSPTNFDINHALVGSRKQLLVHGGLRKATAALLSALTNLGYATTFDSNFSAASCNADQVAMMVVPATNESEIHTLRTLRPRCCLLPIVAVVADNLGRQTYEAIRAGASGVVNLMLPLDAQLAAMRFQLSASPGGELPTSALVVTSGESPTIASTEPDAWCRPSGRINPAMAEMAERLCSSRSIAELARMTFCSERSMYRRVRETYSYFGVESRAELRLRLSSAAWAGDDARPVSLRSAPT